MKSLTTLAALAALGLLNCAPAEAQQTVTLRKNQLQQVGWFKAPLNVQITDERPHVSDLRRADEGPQNFVIPVGPGPTAKASGNQGVRMMSNHLTPSGFQTNISAANPVRQLSPAKMGGLTPRAAQAAAVRPIGANSNKAAKQNIFTGPTLATMKSTPTAATYGLNSHSGAGSTQFGSQSGFSKEVLAKLRHASN